MGFMWDEFQFIEHGGRRTLPRPVHGFAAGGAYAGHRYSQTEYERCDVHALDLSPRFGDFHISILGRIYIL